MIRPLSLVAGWVLVPIALMAQDSVAVDTARAPADSVALPAAPGLVALEGPQGPLPNGSRWVFTRDSLAWSTAYTVADLLAEIPGVFTARTGFVQAAAPVGVGGRGSDGIELFWDGVPWQPVGPDSLGPDLAAISLFTVRRVEVQVLPALLRVYLVSERHEGRASRSVVQVVSGAFGTGGYAGLYQQNFDGGLRLTLAADGLRHEREAASAVDRRFDLMGRLDWVPTPRVHAGWQIRRSELERTADAVAPLTVSGRQGTRTDALLTMRVSTDAAGQGWNVGAALRSSAFTDSLFGERVMREILLDAGHEGPSDLLRMRVGLGDGAVRRRAVLDAGLMPFGPIVLRGGTGWTRDAFDRDSWRSWGTAGLGVGAFTLSGEAVRTRGVAQPLIATDTVQRVTDLAVRLHLDTRKLAGRIGLERRGAWAPTPVGPLAELPLAQTGERDWIVAWIRLGPVGSFAITGWYADARGAETDDLQPPTHSRVQVTYRNKFWPTFRSGAFDLKIQFALEAWSRGTVGREAGGFAIELPANTLQEWFIQFELAGFRAFYLLRNARNQDVGFLPGFPQPRNAQTFGVKWEFSS